MSARRSDDNFDEAEGQRRFEAALRGARLAGPQHREAPAKPSRKRKTSPKRAKAVEKRS